MDKLTRKDIINAINHIDFNRTQYEACEIDNLICECYNIRPDLFAELTEKSNEFEYIVDVYELIDDEMIKKGYKSKDMLIYKKVIKRKRRQSKTNENQLSLF